MAEYTGAGPYYGTQATAGQGANNKALKNTDPGVQAGTTVVSVNPAAWLLFKPGTSSTQQGGTGATPSPTTGFDFGFNFLAADFDATSAAPAGLPANRVSVSATLNIHVVHGYSGVNTSNTSSVLVYKRSSGGALTLLCSGVSAAQASTSATFDYTATMPRTVFAVGDTLHIEVWAKPNDVVAGSVHQTVTLRTVSIDANLLYDYPRSYSASFAMSAARGPFVIGKVASASFTMTAAMSRRVSKNLSASFSIGGSALKKVVLLPKQASFSIGAAAGVLLPQSVINRMSGAARKLVQLFIED